MMIQVCWFQNTPYFPSNLVVAIPNFAFIISILLYDPNVFTYGKGKHLPSSVCSYKFSALEIFRASVW